MPRRKRRHSPPVEGGVTAASVPDAPPLPKRAKFDPVKGEQPEWTGLIAAAAVITTLAIFALDKSVSSEAYRVRAIFVAIGAAALMFAIELWPRRAQVVTRQRGVPLIKLALMRYAAGCAVLGLWWGAYQVLDEYGNRWYEPYWPIFRELSLIYLAGGLPYAWLTMRFLPSRAKDMRDPSVLMLIVLRILAQRRHVSRRLWRTCWSVSGRITIMGVMVKAFYLPIMSVFLINTTNGFGNALRALINAPSSGWTLMHQYYRVGFEAIFTIDVTLAWVGYALTSRWIDNGIRSVERTWAGWVVCLACYRPFHDALGWYFVWPGFRTEDAPNSWLTAAAMTAALLLLSVYVWATTAFGLRFSNLTHRGVVTGGPYRWVRHPAYISKNLGWWFEYFPTFTAPTLVSLKAAWFMLGWNFIYYLRARTEERHLSIDPAYRAYMARVKWRFIPGVW